MSFFFRYPDVIEAEMRLTSRNPVTEVVARASGRVSSLYVVDRQEMKATAGIVTEELRLIERFFQPLRKIMKEGL